MAFLKWLAYIIVAAMVFLYSVLTGNYLVIAVSLAVGFVVFIGGALMRLIALSTKSVQLLEDILSNQKKDGG
ncbi:hypothetical protein [Methylovulum psychrotolerans]|uniref:Uncharacterized protein n=1 Tax=Methylovulum psychrotolerans TaxID=1704499 RepID=A0A2S5CKI6_9GAMM|nr:hypothetical protein [Methylovulum psychrotolerans]POZ51330.1 hypothetical protein AADEFJLK_02778 [Methylovulum psychrotolerans]